MFRKLKAVAVLLAFPALALAQVPFPQIQQPTQTFSFEEKDWSVEPTATVKRAPYHAPTPTAIPGARVIKTLELKALLDANKNVLVIDVLDTKSRKSIPGAFWMPGAGDGQFFGAEKSRLAAALEKLSSGDKARPLVFLCLSSECWLSYNASLHALEAGYKDVIWYRGGTNSWTGASLEWTKPERIDW
ncbi:MAG TPA: rhodanese-like domain-containing protein [Anaerolineales bacterium]|nr:rhodanese-like domain-containing protein [Anaerolineales bacterium]